MKCSLGWISSSRIALPFHDRSEQSEDRLQHLHLDDAAVQAAQRCSEYFQFFDQTKTGTLNGEEFTTMYGYMVQGAARLHLQPWPLPHGHGILGRHDGPR